MESSLDVSVLLRSDTPVEAIDVDSIAAMVGHDIQIRRDSEDESNPASAELRAPVAPIVVDLTFALEVVAAIGGAKMIELLAEDLYKLGKSLAQSLFKSHQGVRREVRIRVSDTDVPILAVVATDSQVTLEEALTRAIEDLKGQLSTVIVTWTVPEAVSWYDDKGGVISISPGDPLPSNLSWILMQFDTKTARWRLQSLLTDGRLFVRHGP